MCALWRGRGRQCGSHAEGGEEMGFRPKGEIEGTQEAVKKRRRGGGQTLIRQRKHNVAVPDRILQILLVEPDSVPFNHRQISVRWL